MCGRYTLAAPVAELGRLFGFSERPNLDMRFNIAPTQPIAVVRRIAAERSRELALVRWGLVPPWADDPTIGNRMINARAESVADKASFRNAFRKRRCLVLADGFYEWQQQPSGKKQPFRIVRRDQQPFALAGLWEVWHGAKGGERIEPPLETATIITTNANAVLKPLHDRMPVILDPADYDLWLDPEAPSQAAKDLLRPCPDDWLELYPVSTRVNNVRNEDSSCAAPLAEAPKLL